MALSLEYLWENLTLFEKKTILAWKNITPANMKTEDLVDKVTQSLPMKRPADAREIGAAIAFLCSDKARYITGVALSVDGGAHLGF